MEADERDEILRTLVRIAANQEVINQDLRATVQEQRTFNAQQVRLNAEVSTTLARLETLLGRMLRNGENGQEA